MKAVSLAWALSIALPATQTFAKHNGIALRITLAVAESLPAACGTEQQVQLLW